MTPKLNWSISSERDYAHAITGHLILSVCHYEDEWLAYAYLDKAGEAYTLIEEASTNRHDAVDAMAECERLAQLAITVETGGLVR